MELFKETMSVTLETATGKSNNIKGVANSLTTSRNGVTINKESAEALAGKVVPLLVSHDWTALPIGSATFGDVTEQGLEFDATIFESAPDAALMLEATRAGVMSVSVGFRGSKNDDGTINVDDMMELSLTGVPSDSNAYATTQNMEVTAEMDDELKTFLTEIADALKAIEKAVAKDKPEDDDKDKDTDKPKEEPKAPAPDTAKETLDAVNDYYQSIGRNVPKALLETLTTMGDK